VARYLGLRLLQGVFVLWTAFTLSFVVLYLLPGDPIMIMAAGGGELGSQDPAQLAALRQQYGFDQPVHVQYVEALGRALRGDFGTSIQTGAAVSDMVAAAIGQTVQLGLLALAIALLLGVGIALGSVYVRSRALRQVLLSLPAVGVSMPTFWIGLLLVQFVSFRWGLLPAIGNDGVASLIMPAVTLAIPTAAVIAQLLAKSLRGTLAEPYVAAVRARGLGRGRVLVAHALRNATIPTLTMVGMIVGNLVAGTAVVETVFSREGVGRLTFQAVDAQDIPVVQALVVLSAVLFVLVTLTVDVVYPLVDPRIVAAGGRDD
jgi:peptide/nickel transport system permease protein